MTTHPLNADTLGRLVSLFPVFTHFSEEALAAFIQSARARVIEDSPRDFIIRSGAPVDHLSFLIDGWAARYTVLSDSRRQVLSFMIPGSIVCIHALSTSKLPFSVQALTPTVRITFSIAAILEASDNDRQFNREFRSLAYVDRIGTEDTLTDLGRRSAAERLSRLFLKLYARMLAANVEEGPSFTFPLRQHDLADATGLTPVHINRTLKQLRSDGVIRLKGGRIEFPDLNRLLSHASMTHAEFEALEAPPPQRAQAMPGAAIFQPAC